jgi:hypothetical protein
MRSLLDFAAKRLAIAMNAVEIEAAISALVNQPFDAAAFPFAFLAAYGIDDTTIQRVRARGSPRDVRLRNQIRIVVCDAGAVRETLATLRPRPRFTLVTDGHALAAQTSSGEETIACAYRDLADHFAFFLPLAGIVVIEQIRDDPIDIRATGRLNALYVELMRANPDWSSAARRADMNRFLTRLVFSFFAAEIGMTRDIAPAGTVPRLNRAARVLLERASELNWRDIDPAIFGSMLQAVADENERSALGMHYTSTPNILKVLNPLFLDDLRAALDDAGRHARKLSALRERLTRIRVFDPACGSGNFLVIAYKQMREIEAEINRRLGEPHARSQIALTQFRGIELREFPAEIARLALVIAKSQCDMQPETSCAQTAIVCGNALRLDWLRVCPASGDETYICGNPPYLGSKGQRPRHKADLEAIFRTRTTSWKSLDYVAGWFMKAADFGRQTRARTAFVATHSICEGVQAPILWPLIAADGQEIRFAHTSFKWSNLASRNAGVSVVIVGIAPRDDTRKRLFSVDDHGRAIQRHVERINAYLVAGREIDIRPSKSSISGAAYMDLGNMPKDGGFLLMSVDEADRALEAEPHIARYVFDFVGAQEFVKGIVRRCLWIDDADAAHAITSSWIADRLAGVRAMRLASAAASTRAFADRPHRFKQIQGRGKVSTIVVPKVTSEARPYLPVGVLSAQSIVSDNAFALYDAPLWNMALIASRLHLVWIATVCGKLESRYRYSNTLGWNTFPVPPLSDANKADLTRCAEQILLARAAHFPATIAELYDARAMPDNLRRAHAQNDETLERIYIGRCFRHDTERLETLFELYRTMSGKRVVSSDA